VRSGGGGFAWRFHVPTKMVRQLSPSMGSPKAGDRFNEAAALERKRIIGADDEEEGEVREDEELEYPLEGGDSNGDGEGELDISDADSSPS